MATPIIIETNNSKKHKVWNSVKQQVKGRQVRYVVSVEVDNCGDEVLAHDDGADSLPVSGSGGALAQQKADGFQSRLDNGGWVGH